jgi:hypothetical protein
MGDGVGELLVPIASVMGRELISGSYIQADETPVGVQMYDKRRKPSSISVNSAVPLTQRMPWNYRRMLNAAA